MTLGLRNIPLEKKEDEALGFNNYAEALSEFILDCETPLTIALQGDWGSGKTSLMNLIVEDLKRKPLKPKTVWFNTWQFSQFGMTKIITAIMIIFTALVITTGSGFAANDTVVGCVNKSSGNLRIVVDPTQCKPHESPIQWNITGPAGPAGKSGGAAHSQTLGEPSGNGIQWGVQGLTRSGLQAERGWPDGWNPVTLHGTVSAGGTRLSGEGNWAAARRTESTYAAIDVKLDGLPGQFACPTCHVSTPFEPPDTVWYWVVTRVGQGVLYRGEGLFHSEEYVLVVAGARWDEQWHPWTPQFSFVCVQE